MISARFRDLNRRLSTLHFMPDLGWTEVVRFLILTNVTIFLAQEVFHLGDFLALNFGLVPTDFFSGKIWQIVTYMFLHGGISHIFFNMLALWMFGSMLEREWGSREFLKYYLLTGLGGGLCFALFNFNSGIPTVGASGAVYGLLTAYAVLFPDNIIYIWFVIPLKAKYFALVFGAIEFVSSFQMSSGIAHLAHLGGMIIGYIYLKRGKWTPNSMRPKAEQEHLQIRQRWKEEAELDQLRRDVDDLLEKVSRVGFEGLSRAEQKKLEKASQTLRERERLG